MIMKYRVLYTNKRGSGYCYDFTDMGKAIAKCAKLAKNPNAYKINCYPYKREGGCTTYYESIYMF